MNIEIINNIETFIATTKTIEDEAGGFFYNQLSCAGVTDADHPRCLCLPEYETEVMTSFAQYLQQQS